MKLNKYFGIFFLFLSALIFLCLLFFLKSPKYVVPFFQGRLGNRIFQVFAAKRYAEQHGHVVVFCNKFIKHNPKEEDSMNEVRLVFPEIQTVKEIGKYAHFNYNDSPWSYKNMPYSPTSVLLEGYFQNVNYIPKSVQDNPPIRKTPSLNGVYFIHIRGGDYLNHPLHFIDLRKYYIRCIKKIQNDDYNAKFLVFSDDNKYAKGIMDELLVSYKISDTLTAYDTLTDMSSCSGAICANSSLSWLGSFFQLTRKHVYMPSKWYNDKMQTVDIYPPWANVVDVD